MNPPHHLATIVLPRARRDKRDGHVGCLLKTLHVDWPVAKKRLDILKANGPRPYAGNSQSHVLYVASSIVELEQSCQAHQRNDQ